MPSEPSSEDILLRLFKCLKPNEKLNLIQQALLILGERCSFDMNYNRLLTESIKQEIENENIDERLLGSWPSDWPGQNVVELDNLGDAGIWIENAIGEPLIEVLFGDVDIEIIAEQMAKDYLGTITEDGYLLPSDFVDSQESSGKARSAEERMVKSEFLAFLHYWRECIIKSIERQNVSS